MASWLTIIKNQNHTNFDSNLRAKGMLPTDENRMGEMWFNMVKE